MRPRDAFLSATVFRLILVLPFFFLHSIEFNTNTTMFHLGAIQEEVTAFVRPL